MNTSSIRFRLIMWYAGLLAGVFLIFGGAMRATMRYYLERSLTDNLTRRCEQIAGQLLPSMSQGGVSHVIEEIQARYAPENSDRFIRITRGNGEVVYESGRTASFDPAGLPGVGAARTEGDFTRKVELAGGPGLLIATRLWLAADGTSYDVECGAPLQPIETVLGQVNWALACGLPVVVLIAVGGAYFLVGRALAPVVRMAQSAERITLQNLNEPLALAGTGDELDELAVALQHMIARLREALEQNGRFVADASHELRTPLTTLRGELESVVEQGDAAPVLRDRVGSALEEVERLARIVEGLLAVSRLDAGEVKRAWARFDLGHLAEATADQMSLLAEDKGVAVTCVVRKQVMVEGDESRVKQVVVNLLDNAIKYTPAGGAVTLDVRSRENKAVLEVADTGIGIPAEAMPHVFERFFRVDKARSRDAGGAGLGLAIVKSICTAHGGQVDVESQENKGSRFRVELPLSSNN